MKDVPDLAVLLNVWRGDRTDLLLDSIRSVYNQVLLPKKLLIVSDGSLDDGNKQAITEILKNAPCHQEFIETNSTQGLWHARNFGLERLDTTYVAVHDADDVMHPMRLKLQFEYLLSFPVDVLGAAMFEINSKTKIVKAARSASELEDQIKHSLSRRNPINHPTVVMDRKRILDAGGYRNVHLAEDYELWSRLAGKGYTFANLPFALVGFHVDPNTYSRRGGYAFIEGERKLRDALLLNGTSTRIRSVFISALRVAYHLMPNWFRASVHKLVLNQKVKTGFPISEVEFLSSPPVDLTSRN